MIGTWSVGIVLISIWNEFSHTSCKTVGWWIRTCGICAWRIFTGRSWCRSSTWFFVEFEIFFAILWWFFGTGGTVIAQCSKIEKSVQFQIGMCLDFGWLHDYPQRLKSMFFWKNFINLLAPWGPLHSKKFQKMLILTIKGALSR